MSLEGRISDNKSLRKVTGKSANFLELAGKGKNLIWPKNRQILAYVH
jgi:hypothetical protein